MSRKISFLLSPTNRISAKINQQSYSVAPDHPRYHDIVTAIRADDVDAFITLVDIQRAAADYTNGMIHVKNGEVFYNERPVMSSIAPRLVRMLELDFPFEPLIRFIENLMLNPSMRAVKELDNWMVHNDIPITDDGFWLGYKRLTPLTVTEGEGETAVTKPVKAWISPDLQDEVEESSIAHMSLPERGAAGYVQREIYVDCHTNKIRQWIGKHVTMERNMVDDNYGLACSEGYHVGNSAYVSGFESDKALTTVKVHPKDVVSVPNRENKCRVCEYEILEITQTTFVSPLVKADAGELTDEDKDRKTVTVYLKGRTIDFGTLSDKIDEMNEFVEMEEDGDEVRDFLVFENMSGLEADKFKDRVEALNDDAIERVEITHFEPEEDEEDDDDEEDDEPTPDKLIVTFNGEITTTQMDKYDYAVENLSFLLPGADTSHVDGNLVHSYEFSEDESNEISDDEVKEFKEAMEDFRFIQSVVFKTGGEDEVEYLPDPDTFPITFDVVDDENRLLASFSARNETEEQTHFNAAKGIYGDKVKQFNRADARTSG